MTVLSVASVRTSIRSSFRRLSVINGAFLACATVTSWPSAVDSRLTEGECVPVSIAMRHRRMLPNICFMASGVVDSLCSKAISPASFKTQYARISEQFAASCCNFAYSTLACLRMECRGRREATKS
jgi:hypothetical protein